MAAGDVYSGGPTSVANGAYLTIQPAGTSEAVIHNIYWSANGVEIYWYDGANEIKMDSDSSFGGRFCMSFHVTNTRYIRVKNVSGGAAIYIGWDGIYTK